MTAEIMQFEKEEDAKAALEAVKAEGADFAAIAKEKTIAADKKQPIRLTQAKQPYQQK